MCYVGRMHDPLGSIPLWRTRKGSYGRFVCDVCCCTGICCYAVRYNSLWLFISCDSAPKIAEAASIAQAAITCSLIFVWLGDAVWSCVDDAGFEGPHGRYNLPGANPMRHGPWHMHNHESQWLCSLFIQHWHGRCWC